MVFLDRDVFMSELSKLYTAKYVVGTRFVSCAVNLNIASGLIISS